MKTMVLFTLMSFALTPFAVFMDLDPLLPLLQYCLPDFLIYFTFFFRSFCIVIVSLYVFNQYHTLILYALLSLIILTSINDVMHKMKEMLYPNHDIFCKILICTWVQTQTECTALHKHLQIFLVMSKPLYFWVAPVTRATCNCNGFTDCRNMQFLYS
jgi:hypothetical protein